MDKTLYIFVDESGDFDFKALHSKHFSLTAISSFTPAQDKEKLIKLRYDLLGSSYDVEYFHATEDLQFVRNQVFDIIQQFDLNIHTVIADKSKVKPELYIESHFKKGKEITRVTGAKFYELMVQKLLDSIFKQNKVVEIDNIVIVLSSLFQKEKQELIQKSLKSYLKNMVKCPFEIYFHQNKADLNCQLADYCGWAIYINWERQESRSYVLIRDKIVSENKVF